MAKSKIKKGGYRVSDILKKIPNRFLLSIAVSKRARQLKEGSSPLIENDNEELDLVNPETPILTALNEVHQNKIHVSLDKKSTEKPEILDEISDFLDTDMLDDIESSATKETEKDTPKNSEKDSKKRKSLAA